MPALNLSGHSNRKICPFFKQRIQIIVDLSMEKEGKDLSTLAQLAHVSSRTIQNWLTSTATPYSSFTDFLEVTLGKDKISVFYAPIFEFIKFISIRFNVNELEITKRFGCYDNSGVLLNTRQSGCERDTSAALFRRLKGYWQCMHYWVDKPNNRSYLNSFIVHIQEYDPTINTILFSAITEVVDDPDEEEASLYQGWVLLTERQLTFLFEPVEKASNEVVSIITNRSKDADILTGVLLATTPSMGARKAWPSASRAILKKIAKNVPKSEYTKYICEIDPASVDRDLYLLLSNLENQINYGILQAPEI